MAKTLQTTGRVGPIPSLSLPGRVWFGNGAAARTPSQSRKMGSNMAGRAIRR
jgi:hypothetical protein